MITSFFSQFSLLFLFKVTIILFLFSLNIYLYFLDSNKTKNTYLESGVFNSGIFKRYFNYAAGAASLYGTYLTYTEQEKKIKSLEEQKILNYNPFNSPDYLRDQLIAEKAKTTRREVEILKLQELHDKVLNSYTKTVEVKNLEQTANSATDEYQLKAEVAQKLASAESSFRDAERLYAEMQNTNPNFNSKLFEELMKNKTKFNSSNSELSNIIQQSIDDNKVVNTSDDDPINKSFFLSEVFNKFETLDLFSKLAVSILFLKNVLISALISIVFVLYGDILIKYYKLESRFPKLTQIIELRRKFSRYYLILNCSIVVLVILTEVVFCLAVLLH